MQYQIKSDNISMSPSMENLAKTKFSKIESRFKQFDSDSVTCKVVLNKAPGTEEKFMVKATISISGRDYFSDETDYTLESALIKTVDELLRMIEKDKISH